MAKSVTLLHALQRHVLLVTVMNYTINTQAVISVGVALSKLSRQLPYLGSRDIAFRVYITWLGLPDQLQRYYPTNYIFSPTPFTQQWKHRSTLSGGRMWYGLLPRKPSGTRKRKVSFQRVENDSQSHTYRTWSYRTATFVTVWVVHTLSTCPRSLL